MQRTLCATFTLLALLGATLTLAPAPARADGGVTFTDIAAGDSNGITYRRTPSPHISVRNDIISELSVTPMPVGDFLTFARPGSPQKGRGAPGVALFDHDGDGDLDIYVTNGPGSANSLYSNQLAESGAVTFVDVAAAAGVEATAQDSTGVCFGDIDNDGDDDLYVLGTGEPHKLFENDGDGTFTDITGPANAAGPNRHSAACSFGDVNADGLLDVVIANTYSGCSNPINPNTGQPFPCTWDGTTNQPDQNGWEHRLAVFGALDDPYPLMEHNTLLVNLGNNTFVDDSAASGLENVSFLSGPGLSGGAFTWAIAMWDWNLDGDADVLAADNQGASTIPAGLTRLYDNDGTGDFTEVTVAAGLLDEGGWMGVSVADFNCDGLMDFFATDLGSYGGGAPFTSQWFLQNPDGTFSWSIGDLKRTPFGWGTSTFDYDNDADADIIYHGSNDILNLILADNPGVLLTNDGECSGDFSYDADALLTDHRLRTVHGVATGDLNDDGFSDIVTVSNLNIEPTQVYLPAFLLAGGPVGSPFDSVARFQNVLTGNLMPGFVIPVNPLPNLPNGTLAVELNSADNGNNWGKVTLVGSAGVLPSGSVNRNGIGSSVFITPEGGKTSIYQVLGGASYASQDSLEKPFGLGSADAGTVEVLWPGGIRNRLYDVQAGESVTFPHIPCDFAADWKNFGQYNACVQQALNAYKDAGILSDAEKNRFRASAIQAYDEAQ